MPKHKRPATSSTKIVHLKALSGARGDAYRRVLDTVGVKRRNPAISLSKAAKQSGTTLRTVRKYAGSVIEIRSGRLDVGSSDRLPRRMRMLTDRGEVAVLVRSSKTASRISHYNNAVKKFYISGGDTSALRPFEGKGVRSGGQRYDFVTDPPTLNRLGRAGAVHFLDIYAPESDL